MHYGVMCMDGTISCQVVKSPNPKVDQGLRPAPLYFMFVCSYSIVPSHYVVRSLISRVFVFARINKTPAGSIIFIHFYMSMTTIHNTAKVEEMLKIRINKVLTVFVGAN